MKIIDSTIIVAFNFNGWNNHWFYDRCYEIKWQNHYTEWTIRKMKMLKLTIIFVNGEEKSNDNESKDWSVKNMINWKIRFKNPVFYIQLIVSIISSIFAYMGITASEITSWYKLFEIIRQAFSNPYIILLWL